MCLRFLHTRVAQRGVGAGVEGGEDGCERVCCCTGRGFDGCIALVCGVVVLGCGVLHACSPRESQ